MSVSDGRVFPSAAPFDFSVLPPINHGLKLHLSISVFTSRNMCPMLFFPLLDTPSEKSGKSAIVALCLLISACRTDKLHFSVGALLHWAKKVPRERSGM